MRGSRGGGGPLPLGKIKFLIYLAPSPPPNLIYLGPLTHTPPGAKISGSTHGSHDGFNLVMVSLKEKRLAGHKVQCHGHSVLDIERQCPLNIRIFVWYLNNGEVNLLINSTFPHGEHSDTHTRFLSINHLLFNQV